MTRAERQVIKRSHPLWSVIDEMCFKAKNLYNHANYILRQEYIENNRYIPYRQMNKELKTHIEYKECMSQPANCILRLLDKNWKSYARGGSYERGRSNRRSYGRMESRDDFMDRIEELMDEAPDEATRKKFEKLMMEMR